MKGILRRKIGIISAVALTALAFGGIKLYSALGNEQKAKEWEKDKQMGKPPVLGIDLGTTNSVLSIYWPSKASVEILTYGLSRTTFPSFIKFEVIQERPPELALKEMEKREKEYAAFSHFPYDGLWLKKGVRKMVKPLVGWEALEKVKNEKDVVENYIYRFKPLMARDSDKGEDMSVIQETKSRVKYDLQSRIEPSTGKNVVGIGIMDNGECIGWGTPGYFSTLILRSLKKAVDEMVDNKESKMCVVTVPAYFNDKQKIETRVSAMDADLKVISDGIINEPTSAAIAYAYTCSKASGSLKKDGEGMLVFDFGGGTLDISYLSSAHQTIEVKGHVGDNFLGGGNVDDKIYDHLVKQMTDKHVISSKDDLDVNATLRLRRLAEEMKIKLCNDQNVIDEVVREKAKKAKTKPDYKTGENNAERKSRFFVSESAGEVDLSLDTNKLNELCEDIFSKIRGLIFNKATEKQSDGILNRINMSNEKIEKVLYVGGSSRIPGVRRELMEIFENAEHSFDLDPDTCVSVGAAYHAAATEGYIKEKDYIALVDALPMNVGIRLDKDIFGLMAKAGEKVPNTFTQVFATTGDAQKTVTIEIGQTPTSTKRFSATKMIGKFSLNMPNNNLPRGQKLIEVTFEFENGGDISVKARELGVDGKEENRQEIVIKKDDTRMEDREIERMNKDYKERKHEEEIWLNMHEEHKKFEELLANIKEAASQVPESSKKRAELENLYNENNFWAKTKRENHEKLSDEQMVKALEEKRKEVEEAFQAIAKSAKEETGGEEAQKKEEEENIPREDL